MMKVVTKLTKNNDSPYTIQHISNIIGLENYAVLHLGLRRYYLQWFVTGAKVCYNNFNAIASLNISFLLLKNQTKHSYDYNKIIHIFFEYSTKLWMLAIRITRSIETCFTLLYL